MLRRGEAQAGWAVYQPQRMSFIGTRFVTHATVNLVLLRFALLLHHEQSVVEEEDHELVAVTLSSTSLLQRALVHQLSSLLPQTQVLGKYRSIYALI